MKQKIKNDFVTHQTIVYSAALGSILLVAVALFVFLLPITSTSTKTPCPTTSAKAFALYGMADNWLVVGDAISVTSYLATDFPDLSEPKKLSVPSDHLLLVSISASQEGDFRHVVSDKLNVPTSYSPPGTTTYTVSCSI